ncbi:MAG: IS4 family transposase [Bacteroidota bacterium]
MFPTSVSSNLGKQTAKSFHPYSYDFGSSGSMGGSLYGDLRLSRRKRSLVSRMLSSQSSIISQNSRDDSELRAYQRLLSHDSLEIGLMIKELVDTSLADVEGKELLVVVDTCSLSFLKQRKRLASSESLGFTDTRDSWGCFVHPALVLDAEKGELLGLSEVLIWSLTDCAFGYNDRKGEGSPIEIKSSYCWIQSALDSKIHLHPARKITFIADRQADIYEAFSKIVDQRSDIITRIKYNRTIIEGPGKLYPYLDQLEVAATVQCKIRADKRIPRKGRIAKMEVRFGSLHIKRPYKASRSGIRNYPESLAMQVVDIREENPPKGEKPIHWRLLTSKEVKNWQQALEIIEAYRKRWHIEQLFRLLQKQGLNIEANRLFSAKAILRLLIMALEAATAILTLNLAYKGERIAPITEIFTPKEEQCLKILNQKLEGKTQRLQNPFEPQTLMWAAWIIARLGGWMGDPSKAKPGPIVFKRGYIRFQDIFQGFLFQIPGIDTS